MEFKHFVFAEDKFSFGIGQDKLKLQLQCLKEQLDEKWDIDGLDHKNRKLYILLLTMSLCHDCVLNQDDQNNEVQLDDQLKQQIDSQYQMVQSQQIDVQQQQSNEQQQELDKNQQQYNPNQQKTNKSQEKKQQIEYTGQSPDEITLLQAAREMGFEYLGVKQGLAILKIFETERQFEILYNFEFDSDRKRSSVVVRDIKTNLKLVLVKGADNVIKDIISFPEPSLQIIDNHLDIFSKQGLRTLCYGFKKIENNELEQFDKQYNDMYSSQQKEELQKLIFGIESGIKLLGCTAIEDKLQENVDNVIQDILNANIKIWMLTGDKLETAENIGKSCGIIGIDFQIIRVRQKTKDQIINKFKEIHQINQLSQKINKKTCLVIDGECLQMIMEDSNLSQIFNKLSFQSESLIICRCTPLQKAQIIKQNKKFNKQVTLAIGDGANDVNMIQAADIGIGIYGNEGLRASQASDFAVGQFQDLRHLLFQHGRQFYLKTSNTVLYFFYKNFLFTLPQILYAFCCSYSGQPFFDEWYISLYNMCFTAWPLLLYAIFDKDMDYIRVQDDKIVKDNLLYQLMPYLYYQSNSNRVFNYTNFTTNLVVASCQATLIFLINIMMFYDQILNIQSRPFSSDLWSISISTFTSIYLVVTIKISLMFQNVNWIAVTGIVPLSLLVFILYFVASTFIPLGHVQNVPLNLATSPQFWTQLLFCSLAAFLFELLILIQSNRQSNINYIIRQYINLSSYGQPCQHLEHQITQFIRKNQKRPNFKIRSSFRNQKKTPSYNQIEQQVFDHFTANQELTDRLFQENQNQSHSKDQPQTLQMSITSK